ncbi:UNVERIFIED_CONTAM: putative aquaporin NIP5-1 [Sesamum indicum]
MSAGDARGNVDTAYAIDNLQTEGFNGLTSQVPAGFSTPNYIFLSRKVGAEFVGTFILIFAAAAGPIVNRKYDGAETLIGNAACSGLAVTIVVLSTGHISGAHLNPSVTIAFAALRHFPWLQVPGYIAAQVSTSLCASSALKALFPPFISAAVTVPSVGTSRAFALEFLITFSLLCHNCSRH